MTQAFREKWEATLIWCHYVDLVPERFQSCSLVPKSENEGYIEKKEDRDWEEAVDVCGRLNPDLPPASRDAVLEEIDDPEGRFVVRTRKALIRYVTLWMESRTVKVPGRKDETKVWIVEV